MSQKNCLFFFLKATLNYNGFNPRVCEGTLKLWISSTDGAAGRFWRLSGRRLSPLIVKSSRSLKSHLICTCCSYEYIKSLMPGVLYVLY